jgi:GT2 family glycosyltransferase
MPALSVIIPSYNRAAQLDATLASLARQANTDFQVILVNHGSTDNTEAVYRKYQETLSISYYGIARDGIHFDNVPRHFGVQKADALLIVFLDTGMVVPSWYIDTHIAFHRSHPEHVGIGLQHGYQGMESFDSTPGTSDEEQGISLLDRIDIDQAYAHIKAEHLEDQREGIDLNTSYIPWFFGWSANLSMTREAYDACGGFDQDLEGWGFKDVDLCYRLAKQGQKLAFIENGWGIELPQSRTPILNRLQSHQLNQLRCYNKQRSIELEGLLLAQAQLSEAIKSYYERPETSEGQGTIPLSTIMDRLRSEIADYSEEMVKYLIALKQQDLRQLPLPEEIRTRFAHPSLLVGGTMQDDEYYDYVAVGDPHLRSTPSVWSCWGIRTPLPNQSLATVVVSDIWKKLNWSLQFPFGLPGVLLLENLVIEIKRIATKAVFLHSSFPSSDQSNLVQVLEQTCQKHQLDFELLVLV